MKKDLFLIFGLFAFIVVLLLFGRTMGIGSSGPVSNTSTQKSSSIIPVTIGALTIDVEIANNTKLQEQGLSGRAILPVGRGMLFVYENEAERTFWMRDVSFPLDIIWINSQFKIIGIDHNVQPEAGVSDDKLKRYGQNYKSQYVLEINGGTASKNGIKTGDVVHFVLP